MVSRPWRSSARAHLTPVRGALVSNRPSRWVFSGGEHIGGLAVLLAVPGAYRTKARFVLEEVASLADAGALEGAWSWYLSGAPSRG